ncbi:NUDIX hydrolase [uncultured Photobacterium sp.]|uniref:NUDIX hydrolase n=1 Tax=uncultured Photobacterium sp. TaxID=173973 RepID=UPI0026276C00|nr:NUDIX hydrolase [uncultured Photobacterium sp.]
MRLLKSTVHPDIETLEGSIFHRKAARGIILNGEDILMLYTERYHDYTLPGGGIDEGEDAVAGLIRELEEETGACNIRDIEPFGMYEEFRPWYKPEHDIMHMESYCYVCTIDAELGETKLEDYEINNGMKPVWLNIYDAIAHNEETIANSDKKGMSIERETFLLKQIAAELLPSKLHQKAS